MNKIFFGITPKIYILIALVLMITSCGRDGQPTDPAVELREGSDTSHAPVRSELPPQATYVDDEVLVSFHENITANSMSDLARDYPLELVKEIVCLWDTIYEFKITDGTDVFEIIEQLSVNSFIRIVQPNWKYELTGVPYFPNDPLWESDDEGDDPRDSIYEQWGPAKVGADSVWNEGIGTDDVVIAILDTGIRWDHEDLADHIWMNEDEIPDNGIDDDDNGYIDDIRGWDCASDDNDPWDEGYWMGHGTACAGVAAAIQDNNKGCSGIAPGVSIMALRMYGGAWDSSVIEGINYAVSNEADIVSMSFGGSSPSSLMEEAMDFAWDDGNGISLLAAAGNYEDIPPLYPAGFDSVICVGATMPFASNGQPIDEKKITRGEDGYHWGSNYGEGLTVMAFGDNYITTDWAAADAYMDGTYGNFFGGTSCACPMAAGVMALIYSFHPGETAAWYRERLSLTADDLHNTGFDFYSGHGRCNALRAVYGPDRYSDSEDLMGFVEMDTPSLHMVDSIHDVPANPYRDTVDLYKFTSTRYGLKEVHLDIYTGGESLDLTVYSDPEMTELVGMSTGENHAGSSFESVLIDTQPGEEYFIKVESNFYGDSTIYGLEIVPVDAFRLVGFDQAPVELPDGGANELFLSLEITAYKPVTVDGLNLGLMTSLPFGDITSIAIFDDTNDNESYDIGDLLIQDYGTPDFSRIRFENLGVEIAPDETRRLFVTVSIPSGLPSSTLKLTIESYKDFVTREGYVARYEIFPIRSKTCNVGT